MKFQLSLIAAIVSLAASVGAQGSSDPNCLTACAPLSKTTSKCGFDLIHDSGTATDKQLLCMCKVKNFVADDHSCEMCLNKIGDLSDEDYQKTLSLKATCDILTASGARSITHGGCGYLVPAVLVAVGAAIMV